LSRSDSRPHSLGGVERSGDDALIAGAPAQIPRDSNPDLCLGGIRIIAKKLDESGQHAGRTETALKPVVIRECLLQRMEGAVACGQAFDGRDLVLVGLHRQHQAGSHGSPIKQYRACSANTVLAAKMRSGQTQLMSQEIRKRGSTAYRFRVAFPIDINRNATLVHIVSLSRQCL
jgi:hypothetical protein